MPACLKVAASARLQTRREGMKHSITAMLVAIVASCWSSSAVADLKKARNFFDAGRYSETLLELKPHADETDKDAAEVLGWFRRAAEHGSAAAQYNLGVMYVYGEHVQQDHRQAASWFRQAAEQGYAPAQYNLGYLHERGLGVQKDEPQALEWYRKAADQGDVAAQNNLGVAYENGLGVPKDEQRALDWYLKAAGKGFAEAQANLGLLYTKGRGASKDERQAADWFRKAAEQGLASAQTNLGDMYSRGAGGLLQDDVAAAQLFESAARKGDGYAQFNIGLAYRDGRGVKEDVVVAYAWLNLVTTAANSPRPDGSPERDQLAQLLTKEQVAEGQRLAREWKPGALLGASRITTTTGSQQTSSAQASTGNPFPARPRATPGRTTCNTKCVNSDCYRTYDDGRRVRFAARQIWNSSSNQFEWDTGGC